MPYRWNEAAGRYINARGRFVAPAAVWRALDEALQQAALDVVQKSVAYREGRLSLAEWQQAMADQVKAAHLAGGAAAKGGWDQLAPADLGRLGRIIRQQYRLLRRFAGQLQRGEQFPDGTFMRRAVMYVEAGRATFHAVKQRDMQARGYTEYRNVLGEAEHCSDCVEASKQGWVPLGKLPPIGDRRCRTGCHCRFVYRGRGA